MVRVNCVAGAPGGSLAMVCCQPAHGLQIIASVCPELHGLFTVKLATLLMVRAWNRHSVKHLQAMAVPWRLLQLRRLMQSPACLLPCAADWRCGAARAGWQPHSRRGAHAAGGRSRHR